MTSAIPRVAPALDEALPLELVEEPDEVTAVVAERVGDGRLGLALALVEQREHRVVLRIQSRRLECGERALLDGHAEPLQEEGRAEEQLSRRTCLQRSVRGVGVVVIVTEV